MSRHHKISNIQFEGVDYKDSPDFCDAFIVYAEWDATGEALTEAEIECIDIGDYYDELYQSLI